MCFKQPKPNQVSRTALPVENSDGDSDAEVKQTVTGGGDDAADTGKVSLGTGKRKRMRVPGLSI